MSTHPRISTIIATCNRPRLLCEALDSLAAQSQPPLEVIVVDDGSAPETRAAVGDWAARGPRRELVLRYLYQSNSGPAVARNRGLAAARGELLHFMDDDDLLEADALRQQAAVLEGEHGAAVAVACYAVRLEAGANVSPVSALPLPGLAADADPGVVPPCDLTPPRRLAAMIAGRWFVPVHGYLFTRRAVQRMGPWNVLLTSQEDDEWLLRAALAGIHFRPAPRALVLYRQHGGVRRASPAKPGEALETGLRKRLRDDLAIREAVAQALLARGSLERYRSAFVAWQRRWRLRYGELLAGEALVSPLLEWLAAGTAPPPVAPVVPRAAALAPARRLH